MKEQVWWTDVEVAVLTAYSIILISIELAKLPKYRLPSKERSFNNMDDIRSDNDILSNKSGASMLDEAIIRKNALDRIIKNLDIKDKGEDIFGKQIKPDSDHPKMRYSLQDKKNPFYQDDSESLDNRRTESEPAMKIKDYEGKEPDTKLNDLLTKIRKNDPKEDRKDTQSENQQKFEENDQTDDRPSIEEEKKLDLSGT